MEASSQDWAKEVSLDEHRGVLDSKKNINHNFKICIGHKIYIVKKKITLSDNYLLSNHFFAIVAAKTPAAPIPITPPTHPV